MMTEWHEGLYPLVTIVALLIALSAVRLARRSGEAVLGMRDAQGAEMNRVRQDLRALCAGAVGLGDRLRQLEREQRALADRHERLELKDPGERPYAQAIRLVHNGAPVREIAETCGLTRSEAELLTMLHSVDKAS
ncbi:MAG: DUF2802 domain-containing protein [Proteobacteria bacterium]|nr:MAG: DUF2802 domain-containing protein [Pseudomonadota bacterium]